MSVRVMSLAWEIPLRMGEKLVLLALADFANDEGECWPNVPRIAAKSSRTERNVYQILAKLEEKGLIIRQSGGGRGRPTRYRITLNPEQNNSEKRNPEKPETLKKRTLNPEKTNIPPTPPYKDNHQEPSEVKSADADHLTPKDILEGWNDLAERCGLPKAGKMTGGRLRQAKARIREYPDLESWKRAFRHINESPFLRGQNDRGWRADLDFLLQAKSFTKLTEEAYGKAD